MKKSRITIRKAKKNEVFDIHKLLFLSFFPYNKYYTKKAYDETVLSPQKIRKHMSDKTRDVLVVIIDLKIIGTVTLTNKKNSLYISSMAVSPEYQKSGMGWNMLEEVIRLAKTKGLNKLSLETFNKLIPAINLYNKFGFKRNGKKRDFFGIEIFEMVKKLDLKN